MPGRFIILNRKQFALPGTNGRFKHLATITYGVREFMAFLDMDTVNTYVEEITGGHLEEVKDEELWQDLVRFLQTNQVLSLTSRK